MTKEFVPYELALKLKQLGFDEEGFGMYNENGEVLPFKPYTSESKAILFQQAFRWFRENYQMQHRIVSKKQFGELVFYWDVFSADEITSVLYNNQSKTYEEAEISCLDKLIEIVQTKFIVTIEIE